MNIQYLSTILLTVYHRVIDHQRRKEVSIQMTNQQLQLLSHIILQQRPMSSILTERKRFNYNLSSTHQIRNSNSQKKLLVQTPISFPTYSNVKDENAYGNQVRDQARRIGELEQINKRLVEDTTLHFKKLEADVQRVETILEEKELLIAELQNENKQLRSQLNEVSEQKNILIEAIFEKDIVIKEYEAKLQELIQRKPLPQLSFERQISTVSVTLHLQEAETQTLNLDGPTANSPVHAHNERNLELEDELFEVKQQLYDARNKVKLLTQQFQAYKILKQIESIQQL